MQNLEYRTTGADGPYWQALAAGTLQLQRCAQCAHWHWPAVWRCAHCGSWEQRWEPVEARGTVFSWTRSWHAFGGAEGLDLPYVSMIVELPHAGGRRLLGVLEGDASQLAIGAPVRGATSFTGSDGRNIPALRWRLVGDDA